MLLLLRSVDVARSVKPLGRASGAELSRKMTY